MLTVSYIRENTALVKERLTKRGFGQMDKIDEAISLDDTRKVTQNELDQLLAENNKASKEIGALFKQGKRDEATEIQQKVAANKETIKGLQATMDNTKNALNEVLYLIPNVPHESVPAGQTDEDNEVFKTGYETLPELDANASLPHWELAKKYDIIDFETGVKITGAGFPLFKGKGAQLKRALINFFLYEASEAGYLEVMPPHLVNEKSAFGTGQLPDKEGQMYHTRQPKGDDGAFVDDFYLIPTAEVPVTNIYRDEIVNEADFPIRMCGHTPCFRREVGSYGKDVRGLNRVHQFDKVEIVQIAHPDKSYDTLHEMLAHVEGLLNKLELPYRILTLCGGDLGFTSALTYDFEVYSAAQKKWLEVSSVSNFETFQANRLKLRFRNSDGKMQLAHTLNGSALALARIVACLLENHQTPDGIRMPEALKAYTRFEMID